MTIPKFRAWHKDSKVMLPVRQIRFDSEMIVVDLPLGGGTSTVSRGTSVIFDEIELMQCIGRDMDGKDVYTGDILLSYFFDIDKWDEFPYVINNQKELVSFSEYGTTVHGWEIRYDLDSSKKLGNKFENPELLEKA